MGKNTGGERMAERERSCCFTGHRAAKLPWGDNEQDARCLELKRRIADAVEAVYGSGVRHFICGMANGCDMYFAEAVLDLRARRPEVTLEAAVPFEEQAGRWEEPLRRRYARLLESCDYYTLVSREYAPGCYQRRNRYMVDASGVLIAAYDGRPGGTMATMLYALRRGLEIIEIPV